jgi:hypothetical protein
MKTTNKKLITEVQGILSLPISRREKLSKLSTISFDRRPGREEAERLLHQLEHKFDGYLASRLIIEGKANPNGRGLNLRPQRDKTVAFQRYIQNTASVSFTFLKSIISDFNQGLLSSSDLHWSLIEIKGKIEEFVCQSGLPPFRYFSNTTSLSLQQEKPDFGLFSLVDGYYITIRKDIEVDYRKYSKAWHRSFGPSKTVTGRFIEIRKGEFQQVLEVKSFSGNWLFENLHKEKILPDGRCPKGRKNVQLKPWVDCQLERKGKGGIEIYSRRVAGEILDYCVYYNGTTFHAYTVEQAIKGLREKIKRSTLSERGEIITRALAEKLGFCNPGIESFIEDFLDSEERERGYITVSELYRKIESNISTAAKYAGELKTLARAIGKEYLIEKLISNTNTYANA